MKSYVIFTSKNSNKKDAFEASFQTEDKVPGNLGFLDFLSDVEVIHNDSTVADITNKKEIHINILFSKQNRYHDIIYISRKAVFFYDD